METILITQAPGYKPEVIQQRIITTEEEVVAEPGQVTKPVPSFVYFVLAVLLIGVAVWAIKKFRANDIPQTLLTRQVKRPLDLPKRPVATKKPIKK